MAAIDLLFPDASVPKEGTAPQEQLRLEILVLGDSYFKLDSDPSMTRFFYFGFW